MREKRKDLADERAFVARVQTAMELRQLTQVDLAKKLRASQSTISGWFGDGAMPKATLLMRLPKALRVNGHWLLTGEGVIEQTEDLGETRRAQVMGALQAITEIELAVSQQKLNWVAKEQATLWPVPPPAD